MTTRLYLSADTIGVYRPATLKGAWDQTTNNAGVNIGGSVVTASEAQRLTTSHNKSRGYIAAARNTETSTTNNWDVYLTRFVSDRISSNTTISGTLNGVLLLAESNANLNGVLHLHIWVTQGDSDTARGTLLTDYVDATEFAVSTTVYSAISLSALSLSSVSAQAGDRIVIEVGYQAQNTSATSMYAQMALGLSGTTDAAGSDSGVSPGSNPQPWVEFSTTIPFSTNTRMYLTSDSNAVYTPATSKGAWDKTSGNVALRMSPFQFGSQQGTADSENVTTANYDVLLATFVSDPIKNPVSIAGTLRAAVLALETNADANDVLHMHVWVTQGNSDTVRGTLISDFVDSTEWAVSSVQTNWTVINVVQAMTTVAAQAGDRIVAEIGYQAQNTISTSRTGNISVGSRLPYDCNGTESAVGSSACPSCWIDFPVSIAFDATYLFMASEAAPATPPSLRGTWSAGTPSDSILATNLSGYPTSVSNNQAENVSTNPWDVAVARFVSPELIAQTISATDVLGIINLIESNNDADAYPKMHVYVMDSSGNVRGTLVSNYVGGTELASTITPAAPLFSATPSSVVCSDGDRIVIELGGRFTNTHTTSRTVTNYRSSGVASGQSSLGYIGAGVANNASGWIRFGQQLFWLGDTPPFTTHYGERSADAIVVEQNKTASKILDALVQATGTKDETADGIVLATQTNDVIASALVQTTHTIDEVASALVRDTTWLNKIADANVSAPFTTDKTADGVVQSTETIDRSTDGHLVQVESLDALASGLVQHSPTLDLGADAQIQQGEAVNITADGLVLHTNATLDTVADGLVQHTDTQTVLVDGRIAEVTTISVTADGLVVGTNLEFIVASGIVLGGSSEDLIADALVQAPATEDFTADSLVQDQAKEDLLADALVETTQTTDLTTSGNVQDTLTTTIAIDGIVQQAEIIDVIADGVIYEYNKTQDLVVDALIEQTATKELIADALVQIPVTQTLIADALVETENTTDLATDSIVAGTNTHDAIADGHLVAQAQSDVIVDGTVTGTYTVDAFADGYAANTQYTELSADGAMAATETQPLLADGLIVEQKAQEVNTTALLRQTVTGDAIADAHLVLQTELDRIMDAALRDTLTSDVTISGLVRRTVDLETWIGGHIVFAETLDTTADGHVVTEEECTVTMYGHVVDENRLFRNADGYLVVVNDIDRTFDALLVSSDTVGVPVDGRIAEVLTTDVGIDAMIVLTKNITFSADALLRQTMNRQLQASGLLQITVERNRVADALVSNAIATDVLADALARDTFSIDRVIDARIRSEADEAVVVASGLVRATQTLQRVADAHLIDNRTRDLLVSAYLQMKDLELDFTGSGVVKATYLRDKHTDGVIYIPNNPIDRIANGLVYAQGYSEDRVADALLRDPNAAIELIVDGLMAVRTGTVRARARSFAPIMALHRSLSPLMSTPRIMLPIEARGVSQSPFTTTARAYQPIWAISRVLEEED
mgnify:FL=1